MERFDGRYGRVADRVPPLARPPRGAIFRRPGLPRRVTSGEIDCNPKRAGSFRATASAATRERGGRY